jgi:hypothetical protein
MIDESPLYALSFDGATGYAQAPIATSVVSKGHPFTIEMWVKCPVSPLPTAEQHPLMISPGLTSISWTPGFRYLTNGHIYGYAYPIGPIDGGAINDNLFHFLALTYDGSTLRFFVDGVSKGMLSGTTLDWGTTTLYVFLSHVQPQYFRGSISGVRIYDRTLSQAEIQYNMYNPLNPIRDGLVLWLPFLEGSGTSVKDYSGQGNDGTLYGGVSWVELAKYEIPAGAGL